MNEHLANAFWKRIQGSIRMKCGDDAEILDTHFQIYRNLVDHVTGKGPYDKKKGLIIMGTEGNGKSTMARALCSTWNMYLNNLYEDYSPIRARAQIRNATELAKQVGKYGIQVLDVLVQAEVLILDDIGVEPIPKYFGNDIDVIGHLILEREERQTPSRKLIITTNLTQEGLKKRYGVRILDRLRALCSIVLVEGKSFR